MDKINLITNYTFTYNKFHKIHTTGQEIVFNSPCIGYLKKGNAKILYNGKTYFAKEGDLIYIAYETRYQSIWYGNDNVEWYQINFDFTSKVSFYEYRFQIIKNYPCEIPDKMCQYYNSAPMMSTAYLYMLLDDIYPKMRRSHFAKKHSSIAPAVNYIESNFSESLSIEALSQMCHISQSTLFEQFKRNFGVTPIAYKHNIMIQHAIELLTNTEMSIEEISSLVGFSSSNYFRKIFYKLTEKTPKELRKK